MRSYLAKPVSSRPARRRPRAEGRPAPRAVAVERWLEAQALQGALPARGRVLEIGCAQSAARFFGDRGYEFFGIDADEGAVRAAEALAPRATFLIDELGDADFPDEYFDVIVAIAGLDDVVGAGRGSELRRWLKPDGVLLALASPQLETFARATHFHAEAPVPDGAPFRCLRKQS